MSRIIKSLLWLCFIGLAAAFLYIIYPFYVHWAAGNYTKKFADVLNSHDMKQYDKFFDDDLIFELNGKEITYADARESMERVQKFSSVGSYGHLSEYTNVFLEKEYDVSLMLPISKYDNGNDIVTVGGGGRRNNIRKKMDIFLSYEKG